MGSTLDEATRGGLRFLAARTYGFRTGPQALSPDEWGDAERVFQSCADKGMWGIPGHDPYYRTPGLLRRLIGQSYPLASWLLAPFGPAPAVVRPIVVAWCALEATRPETDVAPLHALLSIDQALPRDVRRGLAATCLGQIARTDLGRGVQIAACWMGADQRGAVEIMLAAGCELDDAWHGRGWFVRCPWPRVVEAVDAWLLEAQP